MQNDRFNRSLDGKERERERIAIKRNQNALKKFELQVELNNNEIERLQIENEEVQKRMGELKESIEVGKKLVSGAKIKDVVPPEKLYGKPVPGQSEKKPEPKPAVKLD